MEPKALDFDALWAELALGEVSLEQLDGLALELAGQPEALQKLETLRHQLKLLPHLPAGEPLPVSVVVPPAQEAPALPAGLLARLKAIPALETPLAPAPENLPGLSPLPSPARSPFPLEGPRQPDAQPVQPTPAVAEHPAETPVLPQALSKGPTLFASSPPAPSPCPTPSDIAMPAATALPPDPGMPSGRPTLQAEPTFQAEPTLQAEPAAQPWRTSPSAHSQPTPQPTQGPTTLLARLADLWQGLWSAPRWMPASALVAVGLLGLVLLRPTPSLPPDGPVYAVKSGADPASQPTRPPVDLSLVARDRPDGPVYRLPLLSLDANVTGLKARRGQSVLPVLLCRDQDLSANPFYVQAVLRDTKGKIFPLLRSDAPLSLSRLPGTEHAVALPQPLELTPLPSPDPVGLSASQGGGLPPGRYRLYLLLTATPLERSSLEKASAQLPLELSVPTSLLEPAFHPVPGLEASVLLELS